MTTLKGHLGHKPKPNLSARIVRSTQRRTTAIGRSQPMAPVVFHPGRNRGGLRERGKPGHLRGLEEERLLSTYHCKSLSSITFSRPSWHNRRAVVPIDNNDFSGFHCQVTPERLHGYRLVHRCNIPRISSDMPTPPIPIDLQETHCRLTWTSGNDNRIAATIFEQQPHCSHHGIHKSLMMLEFED